MIHQSGFVPLYQPAGLSRFGVIAMTPRTAIRHKAGPMGAKGFDAIRVYTPPGADPPSMAAHPLLLHA